MTRPERWDRVNQVMQEALSLPGDRREAYLAEACAGDVALRAEAERLLAGPSWLSVHTLRLDPPWDPIREQPRFKALLAKYGKGEVR